MWKETLIESRGGQRRKMWMFPLSLFLHALVIGALIGSSYWFLQAIQPPAIPVTLFTAPPPPPPPPPAAAKAKAPASEEKPKVLPVTRKFVQPKQVPEE